MSRGQYGSSSIYTRRQSADVFCNDPFKIQSYNFRYADRPAYEIQQYQRPKLSERKVPCFETYYQNPRFNVRSQDAKASKATSNFAENRRRNYLQDMNYISTRTNQASERERKKSVQSPAQPLLRTCCNRNEYHAMASGRSVTSLRSSSVNTNVVQQRGRSASVCTLTREPQKNMSTSTFKLAPKRSASSCSGCAINININGLEPESEVDNSLRIQIDTDACLQRNKDGYEIKKSQVRKLNSSESIMIDKRLSKFSVPPTKAACERDLLIAKRLQVQSERKYLEQLCQQESLKEQQRMREREAERERLKEKERQRERERMLRMDADRERQRLRELQLEAQKRRECERIRRYQEEHYQRQPLRAISMPTAVSQPMVVSSHLHRPVSTERLPGMVPCFVRQSTVNASSSRSARAERLQGCTRNQTKSSSPTTRDSPNATDGQRSRGRTPERPSSGSSNYNYNASLADSPSRYSLGHLNERKLLNLHVNGVPVSSNQPIRTRINNMPIRITTSQPDDEDLRLSLNKVRNPSPADRPVQQRRRSCSCSGNTFQESAEAVNVNINVYADDLRPMCL